MKFRKKPVVIDAEQFTPDNQTIEGMTLVPVTIRYSRSEQHYYIVDGNHRPQSWLAVEPGEDGKYEVLPFAFYEVKSGKEVTVNDPEWRQDLLDRYAQLSEWEYPSVPYGIIETLEGRMTAYFGDWIIKGDKGEFFPCKPDIFAQTYEPVE